jgi:hypothetical protein
METRRWLNQSQPQTLVIAVMLLYLDAVFIALSGGIFSGLGLIIIVGSVAAGYGIANERKWGYFLGIGIAVFFLLPFALSLLNNGNFGGNAIGLLFAVAKFALLVHPQSRSYQRIWFK